MAHVCVKKASFKKNPSIIHNPVKNDANHGIITKSFSSMGYFKNSVLKYPKTFFIISVINSPNDEYDNKPIMF